ncbi:cyclase [Pseudovibrio japonicus]|uniref:Cyclase n=1 Tax=Pseudovibrio japonicus TaxID=366534 RepID=A0ABQ3EJP9_9HYPH|nr:MBL fold metallo-hydrolase [Pseudovibrio japonicus]GHB32898.1 cyclase [Pseudovibrio japonicus]
MKNLIMAAVLGLSAAGVAQAQEPIWDGNKVVLESQKLADGVYAVIPTGADEMSVEGLPIATTSGFVIGDNGVLVIDSMLNERLNTQLFDLIAAETDKPVKYLVNTSFHGDHSYGNYYVPDEIDIIQHETTADYIDNHFVADTEFMIQNFGEGRGIEEIKPVSAEILVGKGGSISIDLGDKVVKVEDFGFAQTGGDLFVSVPDDKVLWTGNPIIARAPAVPWLLDGHLLETLATLEAVYEEFDADTTVVPGHGPTTDMAAVKWNIDYLTAVRNGVRDALAEGLTLEETVEKVSLPEFKGYAIWDWVHPSLNVPAAYNDLK